ncbi:hypothetical protein A3K93_12035 [Acinetobacter sp. NCu2D-2]|uniref:GGDEF domain-containing protein n=1 Tax=Acinetobacter sp. NCu2D-2 TaxID=1608473 RepID=UPI0007CE0AEF|nr:GGDEF domain-containing protein [Acinetobacter sp. NCu2D-2]ANF82844.1 hypothetical protein A3K93_12035 [Acinetobacter sp. NCu2D-2]
MSIFGPYKTLNASLKTFKNKNSQLLKLSECNLKTRQLIEQCLVNRKAPIPTQFESYFHQFLYDRHRGELRRFNYLAQIAFLLYFFADIFIIPDMTMISGISRIVMILVGLAGCYYLFKYQKDIRILDLILPVGTAICAATWIALLVFSQSPHVNIYIYASLIFILVANLGVQTQFKHALYSSIFIGLFMMIGVSMLMTASQAFVFAVVSIPIWLFSLYINWNNLLNTRLSFLRTLLDEWNYHTLKNLAHTDDLTQLCNRRHFVDVAEQSIQQWPRAASSCLLMFDVDHFKAINDTYGHDLGDRVLQIIADTARKEMRQSDLLARFGGEEFVVLLNDTQIQDAIVIAERLRSSIQKQYLYETPERSLRFTISVGLAELESPLQNLDDLIKKADIALYAAKASGRNRVEVYHPNMLQNNSSAPSKAWIAKRYSTAPVLIHPQKSENSWSIL